MNLLFKVILNLMHILDKNSTTKGKGLHLAPKAEWACFSILLFCLNVKSILRSFIPDFIEKPTHEEFSTIKRKMEISRGSR